MEKVYTAILALKRNDSIKRGVPSDVHRYRDELTATTFELRRHGLSYGILQADYILKLSRNEKRMWVGHKIGNLHLCYLKLNFRIDVEKVSELKRVDHRENNIWLLEQTIYHLFIVLNLAKPSSYLCTGGIFYSGDQCISRISAIHHSIEYAFERSLEFRWPKLKLLPFKKVWDWYFHFDSEIFSLPASPIGRALNAFSYLFRLDPGRGTCVIYAELLWIMIGLEAFYCDGKKQQEGQLNAKTELFLGKRMAFSRYGEKVSIKNVFNKMYGYRSDFVHGGLDIQNQFFYDDSSEKFDRHIDEYLCIQSVGLATLIATIQRLIKENHRSMPPMYPAPRFNSPQNHIVKGASFTIP